MNGNHMKAKLEYIFDLPTSCFKCTFMYDITFPMCSVLHDKILIEHDERYGFEKYRKQRDEECPLQVME